MNRPAGHTSIVLTFETRDRLKAIGCKGDTYDVLINKLIDHYHNFTISPKLAEKVTVKRIKK